MPCFCGTGGVAGKLAALFRLKQFPLPHSSTTTSTIDQGSKAILGKSSQEKKILTDAIRYYRAGAFMFSGRYS
jgi:hypothetical protein